MISLGVDIGGTGSKCIAFNESGKQLAISYTEYPLEAGMVNLPQEILWDSVKKVIGDCVKMLPDPGDVTCITTTSFGESFAAVDRDGNSLSDIILYFADTNNSDFDDVVKRIGKDRFMDIARIYPDASYSLAKMLYTKKTADRPVWKFLLIGGFIAYKLCGNPVSDVSLSCRTLLYDVKNRCWSRELLEKSGISEDELPTVLPSGSIAGDILPSVAEELGLCKEVKIVIGTHDQLCNALGAGVTEPGSAIDSCGTCECIEPLFTDMPENREFQLNNFATVPYIADAGYVTYAYNISAGSVVKWYRDAFGGSYNDFNDTCASEPTDIIILPFLQGMGGTPDVNSAATGTIFGITTETRRPEIYRAILEGVAYEMRYNMECLESFGLKFDKLYACGGGARSKVGMQIKADVFGCEMIHIETEETGALGAAILGFSAVTGEHPFEISKRFLHLGDTYLPGKNKEIYDRKFETYKKLRKIYVEEVAK